MTKVITYMLLWFQTQIKPLHISVNVGCLSITFKNYSSLEAFGIHALLDNGIRKML